MGTKIAVGQGGGPTSVINDTLLGIIDKANEYDIEVVGLRNGLEGGGLNPSVSGNLVDLKSVPKEDILNFPGAYLGTTRMKLDPMQDSDKIEMIKKNMDQLGVDSVFYIGGNDSADVIRALGGGIHIQKTVDCDLAGNHHTSGWASASFFNAELIKRLSYDLGGFNPRIADNPLVFSNASVLVYQAMGRDTGWLTLGTAFAKFDQSGNYVGGAAPHLFLPREAPYDEGVLLGCVDDLLCKTGFAVVVCGEELIDQDGIKLSQLYRSNVRTDDHGNTQHGRSDSFNNANFLAHRIRTGLGEGVYGFNNSYMAVKETAITPQHAQRVMARTLVDAKEAYESGKEAVKAFVDGDVGISIALQKCSLNEDIIPKRISLDTVAGKVRRVDNDYLGDIHGPTTKFYDDFSPLFQETNRLKPFLG